MGDWFPTDHNSVVGLRKTTDADLTPPSITDNSPTGLRSSVIVKHFIPEAR
jgi:hypothetical protein